MITVRMASIPVKCVQISILVCSVAVLATAQQILEQKPRTPKEEANIAIGKRYRNQEPVFRPPPLPVKRRLQVTSGAEQPSSFFEPTATDKAEARQFLIEPLPFDQQFLHNAPNFGQEQQQHQSGGFSNHNQLQPRQQNSFDTDPNQFQQFNQPQQQQPSQNFNQFNQPQDQPPQQQNFQDQNNFQSRQNENLPTLPPVFIPPNQPVGPPPQLQSPIRNLFRQPEPPFSLAGLLQRFFNLFNFGNN